MENFTKPMLPIPNGNVAKVARLELEAKTGKNVVAATNAKVVLNKQNITKKLNSRNPKILQKTKKGSK